MDGLSRPCVDVGTSQSRGTARHNHDHAPTPERISTEDRLRRFLAEVTGRIARIGVWELDVATRRLTWSDETYDVLEYPRDRAVTHESALETILPEWRPAMASMIEACAERGVPFETEIEALTGTGRRVWMRAIGRAVRDDAGAIVRLQGAFRDITEQKLAEVESRRLARQLEATLESMTDAVFTLDREWRFSYLNGEAERLLGQPRDALIGKVVWDEFADARGGIFEQNYRRALDEHHMVEFEYHDRPESPWFEFRACPSDDGLTVYFRDITERKASLEKLRESEQRFASIAKATSDTIWECDLVTQKLWWSDSLVSAFGFRPSEMEPGIESWETRIHPEDRQRVVRRIDALIASGGSSWSDEYRFRRADGTWAYVLDRGYAIRDADGRAVRLVSGMTDLTERRRAEVELARLNRALRMLSAANLALVRCTDESDLLREACRVAVEIGGYGMAWVAYADAGPGKRMVVQCAYGTGAHFFDEFAVSWDEQSPTGQGPMARTVRGNAPSIITDFHQDATIAPWRARALSFGFRGVITLPLSDSSGTFGVLGLISTEARDVGPEEISLLNEMASDLAFGVGNIRSAIDRDRLNAALERVSASASGTSGPEMLATIVRNLSEAVEADGCVLARFAPGGTTHLSTIAVVVDGRMQPNFSYELAGTPCERAVEGAGPHLIAELAPLYNARVLDGLSARSYAGECLFSNTGAPIGVLFALFRAPVARPAFVTSTLHIFAVRAAGELDRQQSDARLRQQASLLDKARDAILVKDLQHRITYWNKSAEALYGWTEAEVLGKSSIAFLYPEPDQVTEAMRTVLETGEWQGELIQSNRAGERLTVDGRWTLVRDEDGNPSGILAIKTDITQRKRLEQQFLRAQRLESIGTLAGGIAHDLNNVLTPIIMSIDLLRLSVTDTESLEVLDTVAMSANRGAEMVRQVLSFAHGMDGRRLEVQPRHLIHDLVKIMRETFPKHISVAARVAADIGTVLGDATQLHQVLLNLCVNARDAMPDGGAITISADNLQVDAQYAAMNIDAKAGPYVVLQVEDSGTGIPPGLMEKIFDPFFTTKELSQGTGLGLSTSLAIVKSHGGFIRAYSEPGRGTRFRVYLPAETASVQGTAERNVELKRGNGELVLIVDDEPSIRQVTRQTLEAFGYRVLVAGDGAEALAIYVTNLRDIAVVVTDMMMPIMDGVATIHALVRVNPQVRIVAASGISANGSVAKAAGAGVRHFLPKPYTTETLLNTVRAALIEPLPQA